MQGIGDSSQGFANVIIFVIFTRNIRDSFINYIRCRRRKDIETEGKIQVYSNPSHLNSMSSDAKLEVGDSHEVDERVFGNSEPTIESQQHLAGPFKKYGAIS